MTKLDFGCGPNPQPGFEGVDQYPFEGKVKHVLDIRDCEALQKKWDASTVEEIHASHFLEHLDQIERCAFLNECYRMLIPGGKMTIIVPHWCSNRAYGDPTHKWPAVSEMFFYYVSKTWRMSQAPHTDKSKWPLGYDCDFEATWGYSLNPAITVRNQEFQQFAMQFYKEAAMDTHATLKSLKPQVQNGS